jgi:uncharacterized membrane protein
LFVVNQKLSDIVNGNLKNRKEFSAFLSDFSIMKTKKCETFLFFKKYLILTAKTTKN